MDQLKTVESAGLGATSQMIRSDDLLKNVSLSHCS